ncbi:MAG: HD domain-containing phosphohydrolase [Campylobacterota bacterium]|nr:HD domain-containing phosphohydrolase [Campylobacterota bacterium]
MFKMSIKTNILIVFLLLMGLTSLSLVFSQYYFSKKLAIQSTQKTFKIISKNIYNHLDAEAEVVRNIINAKSKHESILQAISFDPFHPALEGLIQVLQIKSNLHAIYFAQKSGAFYELINMQNRSYISEHFNAPQSTSWAIVINIDNQQKNVFLDENLTILHQKKFMKKYDPRERSWYKKAVNAKHIVVKQPYQFSNVDQTGITYAKELETKGAVLALDFTMEQLNDILFLQKFDQKSEVFLANRKGEKFASSSFKNKIESEKRKTLDAPLMQGLIQKKVNQVIYYTHNGNNYFAILTSLKKNPGFLGIKIDADDLFKPYRESFNYSLMIALFLVSVALLIIFFSSNKIVKPIKALILENEKIKNRNFSNVEAIETNIIEFEDLSDSLVSMSSSIQEHQKCQENLLNAIIKVLAEAIDAKSPYTGGHCKRVPEIAQLLLDEANKDTRVFKNFSLTSENGLREFEIGAWLHDCGKVTTPEYVVDKSTKLETIYNRIHEIRTRFEVLWRDAEIEYLKNTISEEALHVRRKNLQDDYKFVASANVGGEFMDEAKQERIKVIAQTMWQRNFNDRLGLGEIERLRYDERDDERLPVNEMLLSDKIHHIVKRENFDYEAYEADGFKEEVPEYLYNYGEVYNLCISKGTLSPEERYKINEHMIMSIKMLEKIPFPAELTKIPEYAGTHHETLIGTGYPRKLTKKELSVPSRIMAIADIFEALTASDRPYKKAKTLSASIKIMSFMVKDQHIDADLFRLFLSSGIYKTYAKNYLKPEQIDEVDIESYL